MTWEFTPRDPIIKGFASQTDLLTRVAGDTSLNEHFILPDGQVGDPAWIGRDIREVLLETVASHMIGYNNVDNPTGDFNGTNVFFAGVRVQNCKWKQVNFNGSSCGDEFRFDDCTIGGLDASAVFTVRGISDILGSAYRGFSFWNNDFINLTILSSTLEHLLIRDTKISAGLQVETPLDLFELRGKTQINRIDLMAIPGAIIYADTKTVGIKTIEAFPLSAYEAALRLESNSIY